MYATILRVIILLLVFGVFCLSTVTSLTIASGQAENVSDKPIPSLSQAIRLIDAESDAERESARDMLVEIIKHDASIAEARVAYIASLYSLQEHEKAKKAIERLKSSKVELSNELKVELGKLQLYYAIRDSDRANADRLFKALMKAAQREDMRPQDRRLYAEWIGTVVGMLEPLADESPVSPDLLAEANRVWRAQPNKSAGAAFAQTLSNAKSFGNQLERWISKWEDTPIDDIHDETKSLKSLVDATTAEVRLEAETTHSQTEIHREAIRQITIGAYKLNSDLQVVVVAENTPTSGHPGLPPVAPRVPNRDRVHVDEYIEKQEKNGTTTKVRRSQSEIDRERDEKYQNWVFSYNIEKSNYDVASKTYTQSLNAWMVRDVARRSDLAIQKQSIQDKLGQLSKDREDHEKEIESMASSLKQHRRELTELQSDLNFATLVEQAHEVGDLSSVYRNGCDHVISITQTKQALLKLIRK